MSTTITEPTTSLKESWLAYHKENPKVRIRDAAAALGVSEAELLATGCGDTVTRFQKPDQQPGWGKVIEKLPTLGYVMVLTRNEHCVHERKGEFREIGFFGAMGNVVGHDIDLRFFLNNWHHAFAVVEPADDEIRRSIQFFDQDGSAVHKVYLQPESNVAAFDAIVSEFKSVDQSETVITQALPPEPAERPDAEIDLENFRAGWRGLKDTHEFYILLKKFGVARLQALRVAGEEFTRPLSPLSGEAILRKASERKLPIMIFVSNPGMIQIHTGTVEKIVPFGKDNEWINVLDSEFNLHLRQTAIAHAWTTQKPTRDGYVTSVELFDATGQLVVQFFGKRKPGEPELNEWRELVAELK